MLAISYEAFYETARLLSFSKAAEVLYMTQPSVSKHIRLLENQFNLSFFERKGSTIQLTAAGKILFDHVKQAKELQRNMQFNLSSLSGKQQAKGSLVVGASTTISLYVIPGILSSFHQQYPHIQLRLLNSNSENILRALLEQEIDLGITESRNKHTTVQYKFFMKDEVIPVCHHSSPLAKKKRVTVEELRTIPVALRERGSGTLAAVAEALAPFGISIQDINNRIILGGTEALKNFLMSDTCLGFLPQRSVERLIQTGELVRIDIPGLKIHRSFFFMQRQGTNNDQINNIFIKLARKQYNPR
jgi:DNA-binding transcriptional LysR family regulator